jgi:hypothetical protein
MRTTIIPLFNYFIFTLPYLLCGGTILFQARTFGVFSKFQDAFSGYLHQFWWLELLAPLAGLWLMFMSATGVVTHYKRFKFNHLQKSLSPRHHFMAWLWRISLPILALVVQIIFCSYPAWDKLCLDTANYLRNFTIKIIPSLNDLLNSKGGLMAYGLICIAGSLLVMYISVFIYTRIRYSKHGPIFKAYEIHGRINSIFSLIWTAARVKGFGLGLKGEDVVGVPADTLFTEKISSKDWRNKSKKKYTMAFRERYIPHPTKSNITETEVKTIIQHLLSNLNPSESAQGKQVLQLMKSSHIYEALQHGEFKESCPNLKQEGLSSILQGLMTERTSLKDLNLQKFCKKINQGQRLYDFGGMFLCQLYEDREGNLTPTTKLRENLQKTLDITTSKDGISDDYLEKNEVLMALTFTAFGSVDDIPDEDVAEGHDHGNERNTIVEYKKTWFHTFWNGFGRAYMFYHGNTKFIYDEWWTGSLKILNNPFASGPKERALRRIGYVRRAGGKIVAKISDTQVPLKLFGSYNRVIHIYDMDLANDEGFGSLLCCFSQFLTHQQAYRELRLQQSMPLSAGYNGGDMDATQQ